MISYLVPERSGTFLNSIYKSKFFIIISPFKSLNLLCWNSILEYLVFNLFILDYFGLFSFGFRFGIKFKIWGSETAERLVLINILRDSLDIQCIVN